MEANDKLLKQVEESLIDLYLNVKVRNTEEVHSLADRQLRRTQIQPRKGKTHGCWATPAHRIHTRLCRNTYEHEARRARTAEKRG
jgi:hypothetical protein